MIDTTLTSFPVHGDARGCLVALEGQQQIPFDIKRVYYIYQAAPDVRRGFHAHKQLQQMLICVSGSCKILMDDGREKRTVILDQPHQGLYVGPGVWHEMFDFSPDAVLLVLASQVYQESDYLRDYGEFLRWVAENPPEER